LTAGELGAAAGTREGPAAAAPDDLSLRRKLVWLNVFRLLMVTVLLAGTAITTWQSGLEAWDAALPLYALIVGTYLFSLAVSLLLKRRAWTRALAYAQLAADVALAAGVVAVTGYSESVFVVLFTLAIVNGSIILYRRGALVAALLATATYLALVLAVAPRVAGRLPLTTLFVHIAAFFATAVLASYLAEQLRRTGERLAARESDLAAITALHEAIVESVASGLVTLDREGRVTFLNRAGQQISGLTLLEARGQPGDQWFRTLEPGTGRDEADFVNARGEKLRVGYTRFPLLGRDREPIGSAIIFQDLTEMRTLEARMRRSEQLAELGRVAAGLAHEIRNPLASVSGCVELIRTGGGLRPEDQRLMDIVLRETNRLNELVARFLEFSRPPPARREPTHLELLLQETLEVFANDPAAARARLERSLSPAVVTCDPDQVRQVVWNLLANAAQAVDGSGGRIRVSCSPDAGGAKVVVSDDGPGIAPEDLPRIFTPFFTTKDRGTGLGLATVQRIVDAHGGSIEVESSPGNGATFSLWLPASPQAREG
jgi:two-component system sensor histidine kinase PilS (NtrC family)